ncbi:alpha/beta-hydrolase [Diaporthe amygdali]|uniref:alpha/beta-hydrolase n=1 Tax=Phomopsis amygdali TaxID=1214568 RepID=UPI0022FE9BDE|nr:alpha/beta-hydrolase [Diaporthe amygdali]KAJ0115227.1 alpha/beta-hydrolase [Diaporthe amygdali]
MARVAFPLLWAFGALVFGFAAVSFGPLQHAFTQVIAKFAVNLPYGHTSHPIVLDHSRDVRYVGSLSSYGVEHFQNIFYAEDPSGPRRFSAPVPTKPDRGSVIDATQPGAWCPQATGDVLPFTSRVTNVSENCLSLRVARPQGTQASAKLPVMVWLHGGGHALGSASEVLYQPDGLVSQAAVDGRPLIFVAINYRLGFFGFATSEEMIRTKQTNAGLRDQRAAFGLTAIGQSVGASDIGLQLTAFGGEDGAPFQQAILMSGAPGLNFNTRSDLVANNTAAIAKGVGCLPSNVSHSETTLQCLREAPADLLTNLSVTASRAARPPFGEGFFYPTFDDDFLPDRPSQLVRSGRIVKGIPVIAAWVSNDGAWYASPTTSTDEDVLASFGLWLTGLSEKTKRQLLELYPLSDFQHMVRPDYDGPISPQYYRAAQLNRDLWFTCPVLDFAWHYSRHNNGNVRLYEHNSTRYTPVFESMHVPMWRVAHLSDIPYVLNVQQLGGGADNSPAQLALAKTISTRIIEVVTSGAEETNWPRVFPSVTEDEFKNEAPNHLSLQLFGGPYGNTHVAIDREGDAASAMDADGAVRWEKLFERCDLINSAKVREEIGV